jgi:hypothetical protein
MFYGREDVFSFIEQKLIGRHRDTRIVLYGQRRTGKTSVLYQLHRHLDPTYRCIFIDVQGLNLDGMGNLLLGITNSISRGLRRDHQLSVEVPERATFLADPRSAFETRFLDEVWSVLGDDYLVLMMDEVARLDEEIKAGRLEREVFDYLRHLMQHYERLNFIFSLGSGLEEMTIDYNVLFNAALYHRISFLEPAAARKLVIQPVLDHYLIAPRAVTKILQITSCHPYYTQLVCHCMFDLWSRAPKPVMGMADVDAILAEAVELGSANLTYVWEDSTPEEQALMAGIAAVMRRETGSVTVDHVRDVLREAGVSLPAREVGRALRSLISREVLTGSEAYSFTVDLQRLWLEKHRRLDWVKEELAETIQQWRSAERPRRTVRRGRVLAIAAAIAVLVTACLGVTAVTHVFPFSPSKPDFTLLLQHLPGHLHQNPQECHPVPPPGQWSMPGTVQALHCIDPGLPDGNVYGYQLDSFDDFQAAWTNFNRWWGFPRHSPGPVCPPKGTPQGIVSWTESGLAQADRPVLECGMQVLSPRNVVPAYAWSYPADYIFVVAQGRSDSSFSALSLWTGQNEQG